MFLYFFIFKEKCLLRLLGLESYGSVSEKMKSGYIYKKLKKMLHV